MSETTLLQFASTVKKASFDYTPAWGRGNPSTYVDNVTFPKVLTDKVYKYRVVKGTTDLGIKDSYAVNADGSQKVNLLEYNQGYGIADTITIKIYIVDPDSNAQYLIAQWK